MFLVGYIVNNQMMFYEKDGPGTTSVSHAIDYGSYENALRVAEKFMDTQVVEVKTKFSYSFKNSKNEQVYINCEH
jgi:hypothetical protein